jgi:hypothetical protein
VFDNPDRVKAIAIQRHQLFASGSSDTRIASIARFSNAHVIVVIVCIAWHKSQTRFPMVFVEGARDFLSLTCRVLVGNRVRHDAIRPATERNHYRIPSNYFRF